MKFFIVTPCLNAQHYIGDTVSSILTQQSVVSGEVELEYVIMDGGSTDATLDIIHAFDSPHLRVVSQPDGGMYDGLAQAFRRANGDLMGYLNAGDLYSRHAFAIVTEFHQQHPDTRWLTGLNVTCNEKGQVVHVMLPARYRRRLFECGAYGMGLPYVQQESTFWDPALLSHVDLDRLATFAVAGDYFLWSSFSAHAELRIVEAHLGAFRVHQNQLSADQERYRAEMRTICRAKNLVDRATIVIDALMTGFVPGKIKKRLNDSQLFRFCHDTQTWR